MRVVADESLDAAIVQHLRRDGHNVLYVAELSPAASDDDVLLQASSMSALLVTEDTDFGELVFRMNRAHHGVVLVRLAGLSAALKASIVAGIVDRHAGELTGAFTVISPGLVRMRRVDHESL